jgi:hypothetical protein
VGVLLFGVAVLVATSPARDFLEDAAAAPAGSDRYARIRVMINEVALAHADQATLQVEVEGTVRGPGAFGDAGVDAPGTLTFTPSGEAVPFDRRRWWLGDLLDRCPLDEGDCVLELDLSDTPDGADIQAEVFVTDRYQGGFFCGSGGEFPEGAGATVEVR